MKVEKSQIICIGLGITLFLAAAYVEKSSSELEAGNLLIRNTYGQGDKEQEIIVDGLSEQDFPLRVELMEQQYDEAGAEKAFDQSYEELAALLLNGNASFDEIRTDLNLVSSLDFAGITVGWEPEDREILDKTGKILWENCPDNGAGTSVTAVLKTGAYTREYVFNIKLCPPPRTEEERRMLDFKETVKTLDQTQNTTKNLELPRQFAGRDLNYRRGEENSSWVFLMLGIAGAVCIPLKKQQDERDRRRKRERQMLLDYSEIVSKLVVFLGAGLPVRKAWERISADYEDAMKQGGGMRHAYEEMKYAFYMMERGVPETRAYVEFGNRCHILAYRKLAGILEQNVRNGSAGLRAVLETEMQEAFEQRKNMARRAGEEAGTKLLVPLFMMLAVVMVIISVPAFLSFGF